MTGYIELCVPGERRVVVDVAQIAAVMTPAKMSAGDMALADRPLLVMLKSGSTFEAFAMSAEMLLAKCELVKQVLRDKGANVHTLWIDDRG